LKKVGELTRPAETDAPPPLLTPYVRDQLTEAIRSLDEADRLIFTFYYYEELTTEEITFLLGRTASDVHRTHSSAISQLLTKLQLQSRRR
jgi:RNA polymerase sigma factor (sigma-70 family)